MMEYVASYMVVGLAASIVSEAAIGWDLKSTDDVPIVGNPGTFIRVTMIVLWPLFLLGAAGLVLDSFIKVTGRRLRKAFK